MTRLVFQYHKKTSGVCCFLEGAYFVLKDATLAHPRVAEVLEACDPHGSFASIEVDDPAELWHELMMIELETNGSLVVRPMGHEK
jgi:hypothetical protein